jgi:hypothetical protein
LQKKCFSVTLINAYEQKTILSSLETLQSVSSYSGASADTNMLIEICFKTAQTYLQKQHKRVHRLLAHLCLGYDDAAVDAIADLFSQSGDSGQFPLIRSFLNWEPPITSQAEAQFFITMVVARRVEQYIGKLLKECDPFFGRISENLNYLIDKNGYAKKMYFGSVHIVKKNADCICGRVIQPEQFEELSLNLLNDKSNLLGDVFSHLKNEDYFPAIPFNALVYKLKEYHFSNFDKNLPAVSSNIVFEIREAIDAALTRTYKKINDTYLAKGKLNDREAEVLNQVLIKISADMLDGGLSGELYEYFEQQMKGITRVEYKDRYQNILEYLYKYLKARIAEEYQEK